MFHHAKITPLRVLLLCRLKQLWEKDSMKTTETLPDDPVKMVWAIRERIYEETKDMTEAEWDAYVQAANDRVEATMAKIRAEKEAAIAAGQVVKKAWE
jgi:hypothetical protein